MKPYWKYIIISLSTGFFLGAALGVLVTRHIKHGPDALLKRFSRELTLTDSQKTEIKPILYANREKIRAYKQQVRMETRTEVRKLLSPEQQHRFDLMETQSDADLEKRHARE